MSLLILGLLSSLTLGLLILGYCHRWHWDIVIVDIAGVFFKVYCFKSRLVNLPISSLNLINLIISNLINFTYVTFHHNNVCRYESLSCFKARWLRIIVSLQGGYESTYCLDSPRVLRISLSSTSRRRLALQGCDVSSST